MSDNIVSISWRRDPEFEWLWIREDGAKVVLVGTTENGSTWQAILSRATMRGPRGGVRTFRSRDAAMQALDTEKPPQRIREAT